MKISCKLCGQMFEVLPDIIDKELDMREATGQLIRHVAKGHSTRTGAMANRLQGLLVLAQWFFALQEFARPAPEWEPEYTIAVNKVLESMQQIVNNEIVPTGPPSGLAIPTRMPS